MLHTKDLYSEEARRAMTKLLLVDDDQDLCQLLQEYLSTEGFDVTMAHDGQQALDTTAKERFDVIILDVMLPIHNGFEVLRRLRDYCETPVLMLTAKGETVDRIVGLEMGADDYLVKPFAFAELLARVRTLLRRRTAPVLTDQIQVADLTLDLPRHRATRAGRKINLSHKEFCLLELLARRQGEVLPRSLIASQVWDMNFDSDTNVIDVAIRRLRAKIDDDFEPKLIHTVRGMGYKLDVEDDYGER